MTVQAMTAGLVGTIIGSMPSMFFALGKNRGAIRWFVFGALMPMVSLAAVVCLPERTRVTTKID